MNGEIMSELNHSNKAGTANQPQNSELAVKNAQQTEKIRAKLIRKAWEMYKSGLNDPFRPTYHFISPGGWMNDPNGPIFYKNRYHIFFQYCPLKNRWALPMTWGHAFSDDLLHWTYSSPVLIPIKYRNEIAAFSGCCIELNGIPTIFYTSVKSIPDILLGTCVRIAQPQSDELEKNELIHWNIIEQRTIHKDQINQGMSIRHWRDPFVWKDPESNEFRLILGGVNQESKRPLILLYGSENAIDWKFKSVLYEGELNECASYECPVYFKINGKDVLIASNYKGVIYFVGTIKNHRFEATYRGWLDHRYEFYATTKMNGTGDRILLWTWFKEGGKKYWNGCLTLPREIIGIEQNRLIFEPIKEFNALMQSPIEFPNQIIQKDSEVTIYNSDSGKDLLEFTIEFDPNEQKENSLAIKIIQKYPRNPKKSKHIRSALLDFTKRIITIENTTTKMNRVQDSKRIPLKMFVDRSKIEIFIEKTDSICFSLPINVKKYGIAVQICALTPKPIKIDNIKQVPMSPLQFSFHWSFRL